MRTTIQNPKSKISLIAHRSSLIAHSFVLLGYLAGTLVFTWPLITNLGGQVINGGDSWWTVWQYWMLKHSLLDLHSNPFVTTLVYWPGGTSLYEESWLSDMGLLWLPVTALLGPVVAYNCASLFICVATGYTMFLLARTLTGSSPAAFVAGFAFTFSAWHISRLWGQLNIASLEWFLLTIFLLLRREGRGWVHAGGAGLMMALTALANWYLILYLGLFTVLWALNRALDRQTPWRARAAWLGRIAGAGLVGTLLTLPLTIGLVTSTRAGTFRVPEFAQTLTFSADALAYIVPGEYNTVFGAPAVAADQTCAAAFTPPPAPGGLLGALGIHLWGTIPIEKLVFPGWSLWLLGLYGLVTSWPRGRIWLNLLLVSLVLSLGPVLHVAGSGLPVPLPYLLLYQLPGLEVARTPTRFGLLVLLALALLAAYGLAALLRRIPGPASLELLPSRSEILELRVPTRRVLVVGAILLLIAVEQGMVPLPVVPVQVPAFYRTLAADPAPGAVLDVPIGDPEPSPCQSPYLFYQTVHQRPLVAGYLARARLDQFIEGQPGLRQFKYLDGPPDILTLAAGAPNTAADVQAARAHLQTNGVRTIVLHKKLLTAAQWRTADALAAQLAGRGPVYDDPELRVYTVTGTPAPGQVIVQFGAGWQPPDQPPGAPAPGRWAAQDAELLITTFQPATLRLDLAAAAYGAPRQVQLVINDVPRQTWSLPTTPAHYDTGAFLLPTGVSRLVFRSATPAVALPRLTPFDKVSGTAILRATQLTLQSLAPGP